MRLLALDFVERRAEVCLDLGAGVGDGSSSSYRATTQLPLSVVAVPSAPPGKPWNESHITSKLCEIKLT